MRCILVSQQICPHAENSSYSQRVLDPKSRAPILKLSDRTCFVRTSVTPAGAMIWKALLCCIPWGDQQNLREKNIFFYNRRNKYKSFVRNLRKDREVSVWREHNLLSSSHCSFPELQRSHFEFHHGGDFAKLNYITRLHWLLLKKYDKRITSWESSGRKRLMLLFREIKLKTWERQQGRNLLFCTSPMNA